MNFFEIAVRSLISEVSSAWLWGRGDACNSDKHTLTILFDLMIILSDPSSCSSTDMPGSMIPDQNQHRFPSRLQFLAAPGEEMLAQGAVGIAFNKPQPDSFFPNQLRPDPALQQAMASQRFGPRIVFRQSLLLQSQWAIRFSPVIHVGLLKSASLGFVFETQHPIVMLLDQFDQPTSTLFLRRYSGSGLVSQCFARPISNPSVARWPEWSHH